MTSNLSAAGFATARWFAIALAIGVTACGNQGSGNAPPQGIDGLLTGVVTRASGESPVFAIVKDGRITAVDTATRVFYDGPFIRNGATVTSSEIRVYANTANVPAWIRGYTENAALGGTVTLGQGWQVTLTRPGSTETLSLAYDWDAYAQDSSFSFTSGTWLFTSGSFTQTLNVSPDGATASSNNTTNCTASGQLALVDEESNIYGAASTASGTQCFALAGSYSGFVTLLGAAAPLDTLRVLVSKSDYFFFLDYRRQEGAP